MCIPAGAPGAPVRAAERVGRAADRRAPAPRAADLRAGALRRAGFFEVFFFAMESSPGMAFRNHGVGAASTGLYDL